MQLASISNNLKIWSFDCKPADPKSVPALALQSTFNHDVDQFYSLAWNHTNQVIALGGRQPKIHLIQASNGHLINSLTLSDSDFKSLKIRAVDFSHNSRHLITSVNTPIQLWDLKMRKIKSVFVGHQHPVVSLIFNPTGDYFYSADELGQIWTWNVKTQAVQYKFQDLSSSQQGNPLSPESNYLSCMKISSSQSNYLAAGYFDGSVKIWDSNLPISTNVNGTSGNLIRKQRIHAEKLTALAFSTKNPNLLLTVGLDEQLQLIDINSKPTEVNISVDVNQRLTAASFHENGIHCAVGTIEGNLVVYDFRNTRHPVVHINAHDPSPIYSVAFQLPSDSVRNSLKMEKKTSTIAPESTVRESSNETKTFLNPLPPAPPVSTTSDSLPLKSAFKTASPSTSLSSNLLPGEREMEVSNRRFGEENAVKAPILVTSLELDNNNSNQLSKASSLKTSNNYSSNHNNNNFISSGLEGVDAMVNRFETSMKNRILDNQVQETITSTKLSNDNNNLPLSNKNLQFSLSSKDIQSNLREIYPPSSPLRDESKNALSNDKDSLRSKIGNSILQSNNNQDKIDAKVRSSDQSHSFVDREKEYLQHLNHFYDESHVDNPPAADTQANLQNARDKEKKALSKAFQEQLPDSSDIFSTGEDFQQLRHAVRPVTVRELEESLEVLKFDIHREIQEVIHEQVRQFNLAKEETSQMISQLSDQLRELIEMNRELREENNYLRKIY